MSGYEAKAYVALLAAGRAINGYEVAKRSGVPRSTVYESLAKLITRGAAFEVQLEDGLTGYVALPPDSLLERIRRSYDGNFDLLSSVLPQISEPLKSHLVHNLEGRDPVLDRTRDLLRVAKKDLYISAWSDELEDLSEALLEAELRGVEVALLRFGNSDVSAGNTYDHVFASSNVVLERVGCRLLVVAQDREGVLIGGALGNDMWGIFSDDPAVVLLAVEFVRHDIAIQVLVEHMGLAAVGHLFSTDETLMRLATDLGAPGLDRRSADNGSVGALLDG